MNFAKYHWPLARPTSPLPHSAIQTFAVLANLCQPHRKPEWADFSPKSEMFTLCDLSRNVHSRAESGDKFEPATVKFPRNPNGNPDAPLSLGTTS